MAEKKEKVELKEGIMTNKDLAEWFGITEGAFKNGKAKKLEKLKEYAEFEEIKGKVKILKIIKPVFVKGSKNYKIIKEQTQKQWDNSGLDTCTLVANKIRKKMNREKLDVEDSTLYVYTCSSKRDLWGKINSNTEGEIGFCESEFCKVINDKCEVLNDKEKAIKILSIGRGGEKPRKDIAKFNEVSDYVSFFYDDLFYKKDELPENVEIEDRNEILTLFAQGYNENDTQEEWFNKMTEIAEKLGFAPKTKLYKKNPEDYKGHIGDVSMVLRVAVTGRRNSPDLYEIMKILGKDKVIERLNAAK